MRQAVKTSPQQTFFTTQLDRASIVRTPKVGGSLLLVLRIVPSVEKVVVPNTPDEGCNRYTSEHKQIMTSSPLDHIKLTSQETTLPSSVSPSRLVLPTATLVIFALATGGSTIGKAIPEPQIWAMGTGPCKSV